MYSRHTKRRKVFLFVCLAASWLVTPSTAIWPFPPKRFTGNSLIAAGSMGLNGDGRVVAFGDFNGDQFLDVLWLAADQQTISVHHWNHADFIYEESISFRHPRRVDNVVPGDFTHSGKLDLLVMSRSQNRDQLDMTLYPASFEGGFDFHNPITVPPSTLSQPIPIDADGDLKIDLLGMTPSSKGDSKAPLRLWQNVWNASQPNSPMFDLVTPAFHGPQCTLANPHSNAVVDLNGDCLADVFLMCDDGKGGKPFQIWVNKKDDGFSLAHQGALPSGVQTISFADVDRDGTIDMVFTTCSSVSSSTGLGSDCYINIAYNEQLPLCSSSTDSGIKNGVRTCRPHDDLCTVDPNFKYDLTDDPTNDLFVRFPVSSLYPDSPSLLVQDVTHTPPIPLSLKLGDANLDGFPDLLFIIGSGRDRTPSLVFSVPCAPGVVGCSSSGSGRRGWQVAKKNTDALDAVRDARSVSFLDLDEDGTMDIMVQRTGEAGRGHTLFVQNNFYYDAFFLKAIVLNGACDNGWCYAPNSSERYHPFGVSYSGASYKYTVLDTSGHRSAAQVGQLPQTSYHALQTPYSFFGLGRTNNYIENLFVGSTVHANEHYIKMEGVIPNSKVVILPSTQEGVPWKRELFLRPGEWIPWVTVTVVAGMGVLAIIVFVLHLNEKREDELERRRASHHINFDAL
ncbi:putative repeat domain in Vibrio, Colwellia, Bradyrhizobium and Shewanella [Lyophyllum shimeji]|uniref:Repeat domain in Vibrio, Colwellia, Bradyrhizobium and Shewanella n=1 Tax=Lyophyllum shimeji TaxID=47721 RepID=A0A9P3PHD2_LYOSH|nr:putative repeat domain in Vibrio, Colwellia, Bradyrhizobium and Shewanella [Lyophyllum shimeji]